MVKSAVDKRFDELRDVIKKAKNARKVKDFNISLNTFTDLTRVFEKSTKVVEKEGIPTFYALKHMQQKPLVSNSEIF